MSSKNFEMSLNLTDVFAEIKRHIALFIAVCLICGVGGYLYTSFFVTPVYQASGKMVVNTREQTGENVTTDQVTSANQLIATYAEVIYDRTVLLPVIENLDLDKSYEELRNAVSISAIGETAVMQIVVRDTDVKLAKRVVKEIIRISPDILKEEVKIGSINAISGSVEASTTPVSPNKKNTVLLCVLFGFAVILLYVIIKMLLSNTYRTDAELQDDLGLSVIGVIPNIDSVTEKYGYGKKK